MATAPLYKRYVPTKIGLALETSASTGPSTIVQRESPAVLKRKRERTHDEVAGRREKKSKTVNAQSSDAPDETSGRHFSTPDTQGVVGTNGGEPIRSGKKRHKLEKEARQARRRAERAANDDPEGSNEVDMPVRGLDTLSEHHGRAELTKETLPMSPTQSQQPKKRRHKMEKIISEHRESLEREPDQVDGGRPGKHANILAKFQTSLQKSCTDTASPNQSEVPSSSATVVQELSLPEKDPTPDDFLDTSALPPWLASPIVFPADLKISFADLGLREATVSHLASLHLHEALPVQRALIPRLLPPGVPGSLALSGTDPVLPDLAVSAPTGSGKTIAYLLPIVESLRQCRLSGQLQALIIVPTRELVVQVAAVAESLVKGSSIKIGMATGAGRFRDEQARLIRRGQRYDPTEYSKIIAQADQQVNPPHAESDKLGAYIDKVSSETVKQVQQLQHTVDCLSQHIPTYEPSINVLVATPGRLLEHLNDTIGFNLDRLQWFVMDEADKLLDNQYEGFLEALNLTMERAITREEQDPSERLLGPRVWFSDRRRVRKVILSATMTHDIAKLTSLKLSHPQMVVIRGSGSDGVSTNHAAPHADASDVKQNVEGFELPKNLSEHCVPVGDGSEKPLVALELLSTIFKIPSAAGNETETPGRRDTSDQDKETHSDSAVSSSLSSDGSDSSSEVSSIVSEDEYSEIESVDHGKIGRQDTSLSMPKTAQGDLETRHMSPITAASTILIFTASTESAHRLSYLLRHLKPSWSSWITTLVKSSKRARIRSKINEPAIVISTDRASRGLDSLGGRLITHVLQYDVPSSLTSYVHRVGRTARAGRTGDAWTLYTHSEARWFVNEISKNNGGIKRPGTVERVKMFMHDDLMRERYQQALADMREQVFGADVKA